MMYLGESGGLREALEAIASARSVCLTGGTPHHPQGSKLLLGGLPPKGGSLRGEGGRGKRPIEVRKGVGGFYVGA